MNTHEPNPSCEDTRHLRVLRLLGAIGVMVCTVFVISMPFAVGQQQENANGKTNAQKVMTMAAAGCDQGCRCCHTCDQPTRPDKCLPGCMRFEATPVEGMKGPDVVILDELEKDYLPVPFDHKGHADMAEMTKGCIVCHHYTPEGKQHPACKTCHSPDLSDTSIRKPGLKGAYHRQCLGCHRDWIDQTDCVICHQRKTSTGATGDAPDMLANGDIVDQILKRMHPPIKEPSTEIYRAESKTGATSAVIFRHWEHVQGFDLACVECHQEQNCTRCHIDQRSEEDKLPATVREHHDPCMRCHERDMRGSEDEITGPCKRCHWREGEPMPKPFQHEDTGWPLNRYHEANSCRACHRSIPFVKLSKECEACHSDWGPESFEHSITGQFLDDNHKEADCEDCHADRNYEDPPACDECHEEEEGIAFPASRPGPISGMWPRR